MFCVTILPDLDTQYGYNNCYTIIYRYEKAILFLISAKLFTKISLERIELRKKGCIQGFNRYHNFEQT